ncbi:hypothetical protein [uncultured Jannaschia sp.]|uniref:hypothetical protein n=1 Tax=uncultured Jannaschia sp. TaxID=293347 RepID=UPI0026300009|nr:hypothetical protein [uncultured Jannaschia sp.]
MTQTPGIGHNSRQDLDGYASRLVLWRTARADLIGKAMPIEVVRMRVRQANALGLSYKTYAGVRAASGRDIVALLFSSNALGMIRRAEVEAARAAKLADVAAVRGVLVHPPLAATAPEPLDWAEDAPRFDERWSVMRDRLRTALVRHALPADGVLMIGETSFEASWCAAARAAGYVRGEVYFGSPE